MKMSRFAGYTLIEILMVIVIIGIVGALATTTLTQSSDEVRFEATIAEMQIIQNAMIGDVTIKTRDTRDEFGYLGDVGSMPAAIGDLITKPGAVSAWTTDNTRRISYGWNGPYIRNSDPGADFTKDEWGTNYVYSPNAVPPTLVSLGADAAVGGAGLNADITLTFPNNYRTATVHGFIMSVGTPYNVAASVALFYPNGSGGLTTTTLDTVTVGEYGHFIFTNIPIGIRSASMTIGATTYGPIMFNVDRTLYTIPVNLTDVGVTALCPGRTITLTAASQNVAENVTPAVLTVQASSSCTSDMTVDYTTANGTATAASDYTAATSTVTILAGNTTASFPITILNNAPAEADETFTVTISNAATSGTSLGAVTVHTVTIVDDDNCVPGNTTTGSGTFTVPANCYNLVVKAWGGGGGAGQTSNGKSGVGGAGGYAYTNSFAVTPGDQFTVEAGGAGASGGALCATSGGTYAGGSKGLGAISAGGNGGGAVAGGTGGNGNPRNGGNGRYGGGGGGGGGGLGDNGGQGGGATIVTNNQTAAVILIAGGGGGGGGAENPGGGNAGAGGPACGGNGGNQTGGNRGGGGGGGACLGANTAAGAGGTPSNSAQAGGGGAGGVVGTCAVGAGAAGTVRFEYN